MKELVEAQKEYIEFLEKEIGKISPLLLIHGWLCPQEVIDEGNKLRLKISKISAKETKKEEKCTTYTPTTDTSERCLICGELKYEHKNQ